jgi:hypothetical protein
MRHSYIKMIPIILLLLSVTAKAEEPTQRFKVVITLMKL